MTDTVGWHYREARERLSTLLRPLPVEAWDTPVAACPGWTVKGTVSHLVATIDDAANGRLTGPPSAEQTADQVARHAGTDPQALLDEWAETAPGLEDLVSQLGMWPAAFDCITHEHDIRTALGEPGARDHESIGAMAGMLGQGLAKTGVAVRLGDERLGDPDAAVVLETDAFTFSRVRFGRRSRKQVLAMDWSGDPTDHLGRLFIFGPRPDALVE